MKNFSCRNNKVCQTNLPIKFEKEKLLFPIVTESHKMRPKWDCCGPTFLANNVQTSWWFFKDSWFKVFSSLAPHIMTLGFSSCWCVKRLHLIFFLSAPLQPGQYICLLHEQSRCGNWLVSGLTLPQLSEVYTTDEWTKDRCTVLYVIYGCSLKSSWS